MCKLIKSIEKLESISILFWFGFRVSVTLFNRIED